MQGIGQNIFIFWAIIKAFDTLCLYGHRYKAFSCSFKEYRSPKRCVRCNKDRFNALLFLLCRYSVQYEMLSQHWVKTSGQLGKTCKQTQANPRIRIVEKRLIFVTKPLGFRTIDNRRWYLACTYRLIKTQERGLLISYRVYIACRIALNPVRPGLNFYECRMSVNMLNRTWQNLREQQHLGR